MHLDKYVLSADEWQLLEDYQEILEVPSSLYYSQPNAHIQNQIPHAFQDILGAQATPTLCYTIFAFSSFIQRWEELADERKEWEDYIAPGLQKVDDYSLYLDEVPAYTIAMGNVVFSIKYLNLTFTHYYSLRSSIQAPTI